MQTAKIFMNGNSQAVRLPYNMRFDTGEVYIKKEKNGIRIFAALDAKSFKDMASKIGIPPPSKDIDHYKELFGVKRQAWPVQAVERFDA